MSLLADLSAAYGRAVLSFIALGALLSIAQWLAPPLLPRPRMKPKQLVTDLLWFGVNPLVGLAWKITVVNYLLVQVESIGFSQDLFRSTPVALQYVMAFLVLEICEYWHHRLLHTGCLWPFHAVHHSSPHLTWMSSERNHPVTILTGAVTQIIPSVALGIPFRVYASVQVVRLVYTYYNHSLTNLFPKGLEGILVSPASHRWHHAATSEAWNRNFASCLAVLDLVFGTYLSPKGKGLPETGTPQFDLGESFTRQLLLPFDYLARRLQKALASCRSRARTRRHDQGATTL